MHLGRIGSLSTLSLKQPGWPFGSVMPYGLDGQGRPLFLISTMAMHTKNLLADARASLLVMQPDISGDPLGASRVTVMGTVGRVPKPDQEEVRGIYLARFDNAAYWADFGDFGFYRMEVVDVYYVGGFGVMGWVTTGDYAQAAVDPLADEAPGIIRKMNAAPETLLVLAKAQGHAEAEEARMTAVDRLGFHLRLKAGERVQGCRIAFHRPLREPRDVTAAFEDLLKSARG
ncbi:MAG: DUF2470 domain-containing protein [Nitrospira sp.]|nr:DUF2470 domain-containing protein [Nitrospira sp.]